MRYWHIQMNQPWGRDEGKIDSSLLLKEVKPMIGTGNWNNFQCENFKNELRKGDIVLVREGKKPIALCVVIGDEYFEDESLSSKYGHHFYRYVEVLDFYEGNEYFAKTEGTLERLKTENTPSWKFIHAYYNKILQNIANSI